MGEIKKGRMCAIEPSVESCVLEKGRGGGGISKWERRRDEVKKKKVFITFTGVFFKQEGRKTFI